MVHVKKTMKAHKGMKLGQVLKMAAKTYKKGMKGGADEGVQPFSESSDLAFAGPNNASVNGSPIRDAAAVGGRRRKSRKTRRGGATEGGRRRKSKSRKH
jgi:hypothetical protein